MRALLSRSNRAVTLRQISAALGLKEEMSMSLIINLQAQNTIFSAAQYPRRDAEAEAMGLSGGRNKEMRALTIAAFRLAQNNSQLSTRSMNGELLLHLLAESNTAIKHWLRRDRLLRVPGGFALTPTGLTECQNALLGLAGPYSTTEAMVQGWVARMVNGDPVAIRPRTFSLSAWPQQ
jgi:hypothetical protein